MTSSIIGTQAIDFTARQQQDDRSAQCQLQWRQNQLLVKRSQTVKQLYLPPLDDEQWLVQCLQRSPVRLVKLDPTLGEVVLKRWLNVCDRTNKLVFLSGTVAQKLRGRQNWLSWRLIRLIDAIAAIIFLMFLSPVLLATAVLIYSDSPGAIFCYSWQVAARGKLFKALKFRITDIMDDSCPTRLGHWMCRYHLDELPQLFNVLRGEMSLVEPHFLTLSDAVQLSLEELKLGKIGSKCAFD